jgi:phosphoribosylformylglycinamidine (FGAM) synthase PurS component
LSITRSYSATSAKEEKTTPATESTVDSILKNLTHAGVQSIDVVKRMYINMNIQVR